MWYYISFSIKRAKIREMFNIPPLLSYCYNSPYNRKRGMGGLKMKYTNHIVIALMIALVLVAGCGANGAVVGIQEKGGDIGGVFEFGVIAPLTGPGAMYGQHIREGVDLAVEQLASQGVKLKPIYEDSQCDAAKAASAARKLTDMDEVSYTIVSCSPGVLAAAPILEQAKVVGFSTIATAADVSNAGDYIFRDVPSDEVQGTVGAKILKDSRYKKVAIFWVDHAYGKGLEGTVTKEVRKYGGEVVASEMYEPGSTDFKTILIKFKGANPDVIYMAAFPNEGAIFMKQMLELGIDVPIVASEGIKDPSFIETGGNAVEDLDLTITVPSGEGVKFPQFKSAFMRKYGKEPGLFASESYDAIYMLAKALEKSDGTGPGIKDALNNLGVFVGAAGTVEFDEYGDISKPYDTFTVKDNQFVRIGSAEA